MRSLRLQLGTTLFVLVAVGCGDNANNTPDDACGDGVVAAGEACDDGDGNSNTLPDACRLDCANAACGDGVKDSGEECDDGSANGNGDRCSAACKLVPITCGDGVVDAGEECDEGAANSDTAPDACRTSCDHAGCGDGVVDTSESCDNGATNSDTAADACRTTCMAATCGDGVVDTAEACDDGAGNSDTAAGACRTTCVSPRCGDGVVDTGEQCDAGAANNDTAPDACRTTCQAASCGDGVVDTGEACDAGTANNDTAPDACRTTCETASCGDGVVDTGEACDAGAANSDTAPDACRTTCQAASCGDGIIDVLAGEQCDLGATNSNAPGSRCLTICRTVTAAIHLSFDESSGSTASNYGSTGTLNDGAITGATFVTGKIGNALLIDDLDRIVVGPPPVTGAQARTTSLWIRVQPASVIRTVCTMGSNGTGTKWDIDVDATGLFEVGVGQGRTDASGSTALTDNAWHHLVTVFPPAATTLPSVKMYLDGNPLAFTTAASTTIDTKTGNVIIGHAANSLNFQQFGGNVDDFAMWTTELDAGQVRALYSFANEPTLNYGASEVQALFASYMAQKNITISGRLWRYQGSGLTGTLGQVTVTGTSYEVNLGGGAGLVSP